MKIKTIALSLLMLIVAIPTSYLQQEDELKQKIEELSTEVENLRELKLKQKVDSTLMDVKEFKEFLKKKIEKKTTPEEIENIQKACIHFQLIPKDCNLLEAYQKLLEQQVAGLYDHETKKLYIIKGRKARAEEQLLETTTGKSAMDIYLFHELVHAAQDQNFDLSTLPIEIKDNDDLVQAVRAVIEGDATFYMYWYIFQGTFEFVKDTLKGQIKAGLSMVDKDIPRYIAHSLMFAYSEGYKFILEVDKHEEFTVDDLYKDLPASTEQILHPEKYFKRDYPTTIKLPDVKKVLGENYTHIYTNNMGEFSIWYVLAKRPAKEHKKAAKGWDGDRYTLYEDKDGNILSIWFTTWDTEEDAKEFFQAYDKVLRKKYKATPSTESDTIKEYQLENGLECFMELNKQDVFVIENAPPDTLKKLAKIIKEETTKEELKKVERIQKKDPY